MRLLLQQRPEGREAPRFVQLQLQPDLLGGWTLLRETGQIGGRSTLRKDLFADQASAIAALVARMRLHKKAQGSGLRFVLWDGAGKARVVADVAEARVLDVLRG